MLGLTIIRKSKRALAPKWGTKKDHKAVMLKVDQSDKILAVHLSRK